MRVILFFSVVLAICLAPGCRGNEPEQEGDQGLAAAETPAPAPDDEEPRKTPSVMPGDQIEVMRREVKPATPTPEKTRPPGALELIEREVTQQQAVRSAEGAAPAEV